jgi:preprotein translocase subunit SecB
MADTPGDEPAAPEEGAAQAEAKLTGVPITINAQYIKDLSFENPRAPNSLVLTKEQPKVDVDVNVNARKLQENTYEVALTIRVDTKVGGDTAFLSELVYGGLFTIKDVPENALRPLLLIECPRLLFPFARRVISDVTRDGGFPPLLVNPIDFADLYRRQFALKEEPPAGEA